MPATQPPSVCFFTFYDPDPNTLSDFDLLTQIILFVGFPKIIPYTKFEHFGIICFWVIVRPYRPTYDTQTDAQTDADERFTSATVVGVSKIRNDVIVNVNNGKATTFITLTSLSC